MALDIAQDLTKVSMSSETKNGFRAAAVSRCAKSNELN